MIFLLVKHLADCFEAHGVGFLRVFTFVTFQSAMAIVVSFILVLVFGSRIIAWLQRQKIGVGEVTIVVRFLLRAHRRGLAEVRVPQARLARDALARRYERPGSRCC